MSAYADPARLISTRPILGTINFCRNNIAQSMEYYDELIAKGTLVSSA